MRLTISTQGNTDIIDITEKVIETIEKGKVSEGIVNIFVKGSTAAITTIESDKNLYDDLREVLEKIIPQDKDWRHHKTWGDNNGAAHLRAALIGPSLSVPIVDGQLVLGTWQRIVLLDFDTVPRNREIIINILS